MMHGFDKTLTVTVGEKTMRRRNSKYQFQIIELRSQEGLNYT
jgi:hypothetical protein